MYMNQIAVCLCVKFQSDQMTYLQCQNCGRIYSVDKKYSVEDFYVESYCPQCGCMKALNLETDIFLFYNNNFNNMN